MDRKTFKLIMISVLSFFLLLFSVWLIISFNEGIICFIKHPMKYLNVLTIKDVLIGIGATITICLTVWRSKIADKRANSFARNVEHQSKQIENEEMTQKNQQFLDAIEFFKGKDNSLEVKKGALFHLENLALSSPAHRQRVLDFLNSLNGWMREIDFTDLDEFINFEEFKRNNSTLKDLILHEKFQIYIWNKWKNEKIPLLSHWFFHASIDDQKLSAEIPRIYENIIRKHGEEWKYFSDKERKSYFLDFSYFIFPEVDFSNIKFPQEITKFNNALFCGKTGFMKVDFDGQVVFWDSLFINFVDFSNAKFKDTAFFDRLKSKGTVWFSEVKFEDVINFENAKFESFVKFNNTKFIGNAKFNSSEFRGKTEFMYSEFENEASFYNTKFEKIVSFSNVLFHKGVEFRETHFYDILFFNKAEFNFSVDFVGVQFEKSINFDEVDFAEKLNRFDMQLSLSLENYDKIKYFGGIFSGEQKKYFEDLRKAK